MFDRILISPVFDLARPAGLGSADRPRDGRDGVGAGSPAERARRVRFLRAVAVVVAVVLRGGVRARQRAGVRRPNAAGGRFPSWSTACGRNMSTAFPNIATGHASARPQYHASMLDLMPAPGLIFNEWDKHGTCSGLGPRAYFETIRKARAAVKIPPEFLESVRTEDGGARRDRGRLHQGQSRPEHRGDGGDLQPRRGSARCGSA